MTIDGAVVVTPGQTKMGPKRSNHRNGFVVNWSCFRSSDIFVRFATLFNIYPLSSEWGWLLIPDAAAKVLVSFQSLVVRLPKPGFLDDKEFLPHFLPTYHVNVT